MLTNKNSWTKISNPLPSQENLLKCTKMSDILLPLPTTVLDDLDSDWVNEFFHFNFRCAGDTQISLGKFCSCSNLSMPDKIYTYDNCLTLVFISDDSSEGLGFLANYTTTDNNETRMSVSCRYVQLT